MSRAEAYRSSLKFHFGDKLISDGLGRREAYRIARYLAATYAFRIKSHKIA